MHTAENKAMCNLRKLVFRGAPAMHVVQRLQKAGPENGTIKTYKATMDVIIRLLLLHHVISREVKSIRN